MVGIAGMGIGEVAYARLRLPTVSEALAAVCSGPSNTGGTAVWLGQVTLAGGSRLGRTEVMVRWPTATGYLPPAIAVPPGPEGEPGSDWRLGRDGHYTTATARTDARGLFMLCDVSWGARLQVVVRGEAGGVSVASATFLVPLGEDVVRQSIVVPGASRSGPVGWPRRTTPDRLCNVFRVSTVHTGTRRRFGAPASHGRSDEEGEKSLVALAVVAVVRRFGKGAAAVS